MNFLLNKYFLTIYFLFFYDYLRFNCNLFANILFLPNVEKQNYLTDKIRFDFVIKIRYFIKKNINSRNELFFVENYLEKIRRD